MFEYINNFWYDESVRYLKGHYFETFRISGYVRDRQTDGWMDVDKDKLKYRPYRTQNKKSKVNKNKLT